MAEENAKRVRRKWTPGTKTQEHMLSVYRGWSPQKRMQGAVDKLLEGKDPLYSQAQAAREFGVSPQRLSQKLKIAREAVAAAAARSDRYADERAGIEVGPAGPLDDQRIVVPPIKEFVRKYFGGIKCWSCHRHHEIPAFHDEMITAAADPSVKRLIVNLPPGHAKSWNLTTLSTVYEIVKDRNSMTGIVSAASDLAEDFVGQIGNLLTVPELYEGSAANLIDDYGPFRDSTVPWAADSFRVIGRTSAEASPTVQAFGIGSRLYGKRLHRMILDDVADTDNQVNPDQIAKQLQKILRECDSRVGDGKLIIAGTRVQPGDLYTHLLQLPGWMQIRYPAIVDENEQLTLWPDHFGYEKAREKRLGMPPESFELIWQNSEMAAVGAAFTQDMIDKCKDPTRVLGHVPQNCQLVIGLDPAGAGQQAGYTALVALAYDRSSGKRYLVDIVNQKQMRAPQLRAQIFEWAERYKPSEIRVEANGLQSQLVQMNEDLLFPLMNMGVKVSSHITHGRTGRGGKWDEDWGVGSMGPMIYNGGISLPWANDANTAKKVGQLIQQMIQFPSKSTPSDILMALWFAEMACRDSWQAQAISAYDPRTTARWPKRILKRRSVISFGEGVRSPTNEEVMGYSMWSPHTPPERVQLRNVNQVIDVPAAA